MPILARNGMGKMSIMLRLEVIIMTSVLVRVYAKIHVRQHYAMLHVQARAEAKAPGAILRNATCIAKGGRANTLPATFVRVRGSHWNNWTIYWLLSVRELNQATGSR